jgi:hypothetical protein
MLAVLAGHRGLLQLSFFRLLRTLRASNGNELGNCRNLSLAPTLRWNKGAGHVDSALERPRKPVFTLAASTRLPSFHILSRTIPYSATPATHAI